MGDNTQYSQEEKRRITEACANRGSQSMAGFCSENDVSISAIYRWSKEFGIDTGRTRSKIPTVTLKPEPKEKRTYNKKQTQQDFVCVTYGPRDLVERLLNMRQ